ncbi:Glucose-fructose oxidoreductase domain-containing protein 1-like protein, partial [Leptotrombidium deliense]
MLPGVGIFGSGKLVNFLVSSLREKGFKIVGVWDINDEVAKESAERLSIPFFTSDIDTLVLRKEVQLIVICCPPHIHSQIVVKSFNVGKHVLSDWPIALNSQDVRQMVKAATYYPSLISVICQPFRFIRTFQLMRTLVTAENYVGDVTIVKAEISGNRLLDLGDRYSVKCDHYMGGGLLTNIGSHFIDIISFVTDLKAKSVHGILRTYSRETDHISMFRRTTVDTFCNFQMEMD